MTFWGMIQLFFTEIFGMVLPISCLRRIQNLLNHSHAVNAWVSGFFLPNQGMFVIFIEHKVIK